MVKPTILWNPVDLQEAWNIRKQLSDDSTFVSGGTWLRTQWEAGLRESPTHFIRLDGIAELHGVREKDIGSGIEIGALTTLAECLKYPLFQNQLYPLWKASGQIAAPSIRNLATLGGNIATGTGDVLPALLVLKAEVVWFNGEGLEVESLEEWLSNGAWQEKILSSIRVPIKAQKGKFPYSFYRKLGRREAFTPSVVSVAGSIDLDEAGRVRELRLAAGGGAMLPMRLRNAERELVGFPLQAGQLKRLSKLIYEEVNPVSDSFASATYRKTVIANMMSAELYRAAGQWGGELNAAGS